MELNHLRARVRGFRDLIHPPLDDLFVSFAILLVPDKLVCRDQGTRGDQTGLINDTLLDVSFDLVQHMSVDDLAQHPDRIRSVQLDVGVIDIFGQRRDHDDDVIRLSALSELFQEEVGHATEVDVVRLK